MKIENTFHGKIAVTEIDLQNNFSLEVSTMKRYSGATTTSFTVYKNLKEGVKQTSFNFKTNIINHGKQARLTEKRLAELHNEALTRKHEFQAQIESELKNFIN
jgi:hypothetical protein